VTAIPRLNGIIRAWEQGRPAFATWSQPERQMAIEASLAPIDAVVFEMEHNSFDANALQDSLQYMLNRRQIVDGATLAPTVTPLARIPANGVEMNQWLAKQVLDRGVYGVIWPHVSTVEQAYNAVSACRYPRPKTAPFREPIGMRGDGPHGSSRYWGLTQQEYYVRADTWPLNPQGEVLVILMIEDVKGIENLGDILGEVPGIGCVLIGEGDLSQELGVPRQYEHPLVVEAMDQIVATCKKHHVRVGHPHVTGKNVESVIAQGYTFLLSAGVKSYTAFDKARAIQAARS
jgi:4-hydroxy-2-oxoheptanedioate aldolase